MNELKRSLRTALVNQFGIPHGRLEDDTGLISGGLIDSLSVMTLVSVVEREIGHAVPTAQITLENFDSINRIARLAEALAATGTRKDGTAN
jgi:acyl carrier protein